MKAADTTIYDAAVIGAGPAGSTAAAELARRGRSVVLLEKAQLPRYKTCGGGILHRAFQGLPPAAAAVVEREFHAVDLYFQPEGLHFTARRPEPLVRMTMRSDLDHLLAREAERLGARLLPGCPVQAVVPKTETVALTTPQEVVEARFVIAADGVHSPTARACGWGPLPRLAPALEWEIAVPPAAFARLSRQARFDFGFIEAGYAWVFPKQQHLSAGILTTSRTQVNLAARLEDYLRAMGVQTMERVEKHGYVIPLEPRREQLARRRVLLTGDAAGLVDPITAEGISHALLSGRLAAQAVAEAGPDAADVEGRYTALLEEHLLGELRAARWLAQFVYHHPRWRRLAFRWQGRRLINFLTGVVMGERGYQAALKNPVNYLKLLKGR